MPEFTRDHVSAFLKYFKDGMTRDLPVASVNSVRGWLQYFRFETGQRLNSALAPSRPQRVPLAQQGAEPGLITAESEAIVGFMNRFFCWDNQLTVVRGRFNTVSFSGGLNYSNGTRWSRSRWAVPAAPGVRRLDLDGRGDALTPGSTFAEDSASVRAFMTWVLKHGLFPVALCSRGRLTRALTADEMLDYVKRSGDDQMRVRLRQAPTFIRTVREPMLGWRGDSRKWATLESQGGFQAKVDVAPGAYRRMLNLDAPWCPWSDAALRSMLFYRLSQNDNCLFTAVSFSPATLAQAAEVCRRGSCFPKINEQPASKRRQVDVRLRDSTVIQTQADVVRMYMFKLPVNTLYFDTQGFCRHVADGRFPEAALRGVPNADVLACVCFLRIYHPGVLNDTSRYTAIPVKSECKVLPGRNLTAEQKKAFQAACAQIFEASWSDAGGVVHATTLHVSKVEDIWVHNRSLSYVPRELLAVDA